ncbi:MAG: hypothetical protein ACI9WU_001097 [Myxococcota bacterium]|jgi:hypothetical protein
MLALLTVAAVSFATPAQSPHRVTLGFEALHVSDLKGDHDVLGPIDQSFVGAPGGTAGYAYAFAEWFELGLELSWAQLDADQGPLSTMRYAATGRFVVPLLDGRLGLSLLLGAGGIAHWLEGESSDGVVGFGGVGIRGEVAESFGLFLDVRGGVGIALSNSAYTQDETSIVHGLAGFVWRL